MRRLTRGLAAAAGVLAVVGLVALAIVAPDDGEAVSVQAGGGDGPASGFEALTDTVPTTVPVTEPVPLLGEEPPPAAPASKPPTVTKPTAPVAAPAPAPAPVPVSAYQATPVTLNVAGVPANDSSWNPAVSADGAVIAFESTASDLVANDANGASDIFVHDRSTGTTTRIAAAGGRDPDGRSHSPSISADGRLVAFSSTATNLVEEPLQGRSGIYLHDRVSGTTRRLLDSPDSQAALYSLSGDGRVAAAGTEQRVKLVPVDGGSVIDVARGTSGSLSYDGRFLAFTSEEVLTPGDTGSADVFVYDAQTGAMERASRSDPEFSQARSHAGSRAISDDGRLVAFVSLSRILPEDRGMLADVYVYDRATGRHVMPAAEGRGLDGNMSEVPGISGDGTTVAYFRPGSEKHGGSQNLVWHPAGGGLSRLLPVDGWKDVSLRAPGLNRDGSVVAGGGIPAGGSHFQIVAWQRR